MNALFGDATTAMPTPATQAERGSLMGVGSPSSIDIRQGADGPGPFSASDAIPGLDIDPPDVDLDANGRPRGRSDSTQGLGNWIGRIVSRSRQESSARGQYNNVGQDGD